MGKVIELAALEPVHTVAEIATALRVDESTVRRWIYAGRLDAFKAGRGLRVKKSVLDAFLIGIGFTAEPIPA